MSNRVFLPIFLTLVALAFVSSIVIAKAIQKESQIHTAITPRAIPDKPAFVSIHAESNPGYVVVKFRDRDQVRLNSTAFYSKSGASIGRVNTALLTFLPNRINRLFQDFSESELDLKKDVLSAKSKHELADMNGYYRIEINSTSEAENLVNSLNAFDEVEIAYYQPQPEPAGIFEQQALPDYQPNQDYREAAPDGVDADYANTLPGGDGTDIMIIDIEGGWRSTHVDLTKAIGSHIAGTQLGSDWRNHGTAVIGEMIADDNGVGITGICPGADIGTISIGSMSTEEALLLASDNLEPGDAILIELHAPGPHYNFQSRPDQLGYVCMEYWQAIFDAIQYCWAKGLVVIEAGGNGAEDFDDATYYGDLFDTNYRNSHAIIAGAGHPPVDFNDLERESFSNYGERVNLQGYGSDIYTTGYGGLYFGGGVEDSFYTSTFGGTSGASPIVTGAAVCLQGRYKNLYGTVMTSDQIRDILVATGTPQMGNLTQHIGPRPDLQAAFAAITAPPSIYVDPIYVDTSIHENTIAEIDIWLYNRNTTVAFDFTVIGNDSLARLKAEDWLQVSPASGTIAPLDSALLDLTLDATLVGDQIDGLKGILEISWGVSGGALDSLTLMPAYMTVPCFDTTYSSISSDDTGGPTYNWISAKALGTKVPNTSYYNSAGNPQDDGTTGPWAIGFEFPFYDTSYSQMYIGVNGALSFTDMNLNYNGYFSYMNIPNAEFNTIIAAYWNDLIFDTDLVPASGLYIYKSPTNDTCVIEWYRPGNFSQPFDTATNFEIILTKDGKATIQYLEIGNGGLETTATIGVAGVQCQGLGHYTVYNPIPANEVSDSEVVQISSNIWDYVWGGDFNNSGGVNVLDLNLMVNYIFRFGPGPIPFEIGDANCDGAPNQILDLNIIVNYIFRFGNPPCQFIIRH